MCVCIPYLTGPLKCLWIHLKMMTEGKSWNSWELVQYDSVFVWLCSCLGRYCSSIDRHWLSSSKSQKTLPLPCTSHRSCCFSSQPTACSTHPEDVSHRSLLSLIVKFQRYYIFNVLETFKAFRFWMFWLDRCESLWT